MSNLVLFQREFEGHPVRITDQEGNLWWVGADVCEALEISNSRKALSRLAQDEKDVTTGDTPGGPQEMTIINESGLYRLILTSRKPEAERFKHWITHEVLPSIRKTGKYETSMPAQPEDVLLESLKGMVQLREQQLETQKALAAQAQTLTVHDQALADQGRKLKAIAATQEEELRITPAQRASLNRLIDRLANARAAVKKIPIGDAFARVRNGLRQRLGFDSLSGISRAQYPVAESLLKTQIAREEAEAGQASLKLVTRDIKKKKPKEPWSDL